MTRRHICGGVVAPVRRGTLLSSTKAQGGGVRKAWRSACTYICIHVEVRGGSAVLGRVEDSVSPNLAKLGTCNYRSGLPEAEAWPRLREPLRLASYVVSVNYLPLLRL
jgi:hypothetical protein